jgi:nucleoid-associated protein YgaU
LIPTQSHTVTPADSLWSLAYNYLGTSEDFRVIAEANGLTPFVELEPGETLQIPLLSATLSQVTEIIGTDIPVQKIDWLY